MDWIPDPGELCGLPWVFSLGIYVSFIQQLRDAPSAILEWLHIASRANEPSGLLVIVERSSSNSPVSFANAQAMWKDTFRFLGIFGLPTISLTPLPLAADGALRSRSHAVQ
jgi:hypothetical protein